MFGRFCWDQALCINISLQLAQNEFVERFSKFLKERKRKDSLPLLSSECPGWVCYAEKVAGEEIIPYMSRIKSPQQIFGIIAKELAPAMLGVVNNYMSHEFKLSTDAITRTERIFIVRQ